YTPPPAIRSGLPVAITYKLNSVPKRLELSILDSAGGVMRSFMPDTVRSDSARPPAGGGGRRGGAAPPLPKAIGLNRFTWDLRTPPIESFPGMILWGAGTNGPVVPPGKYTIRVIADGKTMTAPLIVKRNPLIPDVTDADLRAQYAFGKKVRDKATEANNAVIAIRRVKEQLADRLKKAADDAALKEKGATLTTNTTAVEQSVYQTKNQSGQDPLNFPIKVNNRIANLLSMSERGDGPPNQSMPEIYSILTTELKGYTTKLDAIWKTDLVAVNKELARLKLPPLDPHCAKAEGCTAVP
ncbi:MAG: glycosyl hydrolase, partial [Gemmatimonadaceae bacterium]